MLQQQSKLQKDIQRSLDRLSLVSKQNKIAVSIPAFYYSANLLNNYANFKGQDHVNPQLFKKFKYLIEQFGKQDFSSITRNNKNILDQILEIVDSELFISCLKPQLKTHRYHNQQTDFNKGVVLVTDKYNFQLLPQFVKTGIEPKQNHIIPSHLDKPIGSLQSLVNLYDELWQSIERYYSEHNIDSAYNLCLEYIQKLNKDKNKIPNDRQLLIQTITREYSTMINFYAQFDKGQWQFDKQQKGITLQYKVYEQQKMVAIRITGQFNIPLEPFLSILCQIDLMGEYVPFCYDCKQLKVISRNERIGTSKIYIPLLTDRQTYFYAVGYDRQKTTGGLFFYSKTINQDQDFQNKYNYTVPNETNFVRLQYKFFIVEYIPLTKQRAKIRLSSKIDTKMNYLPLFILNKSARVFAFDYFKNIIKIAKNYKGSAWQKKAAQRPDLYAFFKKKTQEYFAPNKNL